MLFRSHLDVAGISHPTATSSNSEAEYLIYRTSASEPATSRCVRRCAHVIQAPLTLLERPRLHVLAGTKHVTTTTHLRYVIPDADDTPCQGKGCRHVLLVYHVFARLSISSTPFPSTTFQTSSHGYLDTPEWIDANIPRG